MRTTMTLDDDLAIRLERRRAERGQTFKEALNEAVRLGLAVEEQAAPPASAVARTTPLPLGRRLAGDLDSVADALAVAEGDAYH
jgi:hypothetical protein